MRIDFQSALNQCGVTPEDRILVGFSGGADSTALLMLMKDAVLSGGIKEVQAAHLHHGIRGKEAESDAEFCSEFCRENGIPFYFEKIDVPSFAREQCLSVEEAGRILRYSFLERIRETSGCTLIAVAHHMDDQMETVLLRIIRGTGLSGLCGMKLRTGKIVRPFLGITREQIEKYLVERKQTWVNDSTNSSLDITRNAVRLRVIPLMKEINPKLNEAVSILAKTCSDDEAFLQKSADDAYGGLQLDYGLDLKGLRKLDKPIRIRIIKKELNQILKCDYTSDDLLRTDRLLLDGKTGTEIQMHGGKAVWLEFDRIVFGDQSEETPFCVPFQIGKEIQVPHGAFIAEWSDTASFIKESDVLFLDADCIPENTVIRSRMRGDRFFPLGAPGDRKLSDYLTDRKVPLRERNAVPLLASGNRILCVAGKMISEQVKIQSGTKRILKITYRRGK